MQLMCLGHFWLHPSAHDHEGLVVFESFVQKGLQIHMKILLRINIENMFIIIMKNSNENYDDNYDEH